MSRAMAVCRLSISAKENAARAIRSGASSCSIDLLPSEVGKGLIGVRHAVNIFDFVIETARCVGNSQCFNEVFHTHDPSIPPLTPENLQKAYEGLASFEATRRGKTTD